MKEKAGNPWQKVGKEHLPDRVKFFEKAGLSRAAAEALAEVDSTMMGIRRDLARREAAAMILKTIDERLEPPHLDVVGAIMANGATPEVEVTVGFIAGKLAIDPSRASRLVAETVELGYVRRVASQADSRRIVLELTDAGRRFADEFHERKWAVMAKGMASWTEEELTTFARLLSRYAHWAKETQAEEIKHARREKDATPAK